MRNGYWHEGHGHWLMMVPMLLVTIALVAGLLWLALSSTRRHAAAAAVAPSAGPVSGRQTPQEVLAERLARGEIEPDDYRRRLDVLEGRPPA